MPTVFKQGELNLLFMESSNMQVIFMHFQITHPPTPFIGESWCLYRLLSWPIRAALFLVATWLLLMFLRLSNMLPTETTFVFPTETTLYMLAFDIEFGLFSNSALLPKLKRLGPEVTI